MKNIYLDENLSEFLAEALNSLNKGYFPNILVQSSKTAFGKGIPDEDLIPQIGKRTGILITKDINIRRIKLQNQLCKQHHIGVFFIDLPSKQGSHWDIVNLLISHWKEIAEIVESRKPPYAYIIKPRSGVKSLD